MLAEKYDTPQCYLNTHCLVNAADPRQLIRVELSSPGTDNRDRLV